MAIYHNQFINISDYFKLFKVFEFCDDVNLVSLWPQRAVSAGEAEWWEPSACRPTELSAEAVVERRVRCWVKQQRLAGRQCPVPIISSPGGTGCKLARLAVATNQAIKAATATIPTMETTRVAAATTPTINLLPQTDEFSCFLLLLPPSLKMLFHFTTRLLLLCLRVPHPTDSCARPKHFFTIERFLGFSLSSLELGSINGKLIYYRWNCSLGADSDSRCCFCNSQTNNINKYGAARASSSIHAQLLPAIINSGRKREEEGK